jgi:hypothetical protein
MVEGLIDMTFTSADGGTRLMIVGQACELPWDLAVVLCTEPALSPRAKPIGWEPSPEDRAAALASLTDEAERRAHARQERERHDQPPKRTPVDRRWENRPGEGWVLVDDRGET